MAKHLISGGHVVTVLTGRFNSLKKRENLNGIHIKRITSFGVGLLGVISYGLACFCTVVKNRRFHVIHVHGAAGMGLIGLFIGRLLKKKVILKISEDQKMARIKDK